MSEGSRLARKLLLWGGVAILVGTGSCALIIVEVSSNSFAQTMGDVLFFVGLTALIIGILMLLAGLVMGVGVLLFRSKKE